jgi:hypothetical protein
MSAARAVTVSFTRPAAPIVSTAAASLVTARSARLNGTVTEDGNAYTVWFEYGTSSTLATFSQSGPGTGPCGGTAPCDWLFDVSNLTPNTTYFFRIVAQNSLGTTRGLIRSLATPPGTGSAPVISSVTTTLVTLNDPTCNNRGSFYRLTFSYTDANGDVSSTGSPVILSWNYQPSGSGSADFSATSTGTGASGTMSIEICQFFGTTTSLTWTVVLRDVAGNTSNSLTTPTVTKPAGANSLTPLTGPVTLTPLTDAVTKRGSPGTTRDRRPPPR